MLHSNVDCNTSDLMANCSGHKQCVSDQDVMEHEHEERYVASWISGMATDIIVSYFKFILV